MQIYIYLFVGLQTLISPINILFSSTCCKINWCLNACVRLLRYLSGTSRLHCLQTHRHPTLNSLVSSAFPYYYIHQAIEFVFKFISNSRAVSLRPGLLLKWILLPLLPGLHSSINAFLFSSLCDIEPPWRPLLVSLRSKRLETKTKNLNKIVEHLQDQLLKQFSKKLLIPKLSTTSDID